MRTSAYSVARAAAELRRSLEPASSNKFVKQTKLIAPAQPNQLTQLAQRIQPARRRLIVAASWLAGMPYPALAQSAASASVRIGVSGPFSGGSAPMGVSMLNGVRLAVNELNLTGGLLGRRIELVERDDQAEPARGARIAQELIQQEKVVTTIGIVNTGVGLASIDAYQQARVPLVIAVSTGTVLTRKFAPPASRENYIFRVAPTIELEAQVLAEDLLRRTIKTVAIVADTTAYGEAGRTELARALAARGIRVTGVERFAIGITSARELLVRLRQTQPQALLVWGIGPEMAVIARDRLALNWNPLLLGGWTLSMANFIDRAGRAGEGALMTQTFIQESGLSNKNAFLLAYSNLSRQQRIASPMSAAQGYDSMLLVAAAIRQAQSLQATQIKAALEELTIRVAGLIATYERPFSAADHEAISANMLFLGVVRNGLVTYAYAEDAKRSMLPRTKESK